MGNIWDEDNLFDFGELRYGAGFGLRIVTPIAPCGSISDTSWTEKQTSAEEKRTWESGPHSRLRVLIRL